MNKINNLGKTFTFNYLMMKTFKLCLLLVTLFLTVACEKKADNISNAIVVSVLTADGKNALAAPVLYNESNISIYHIVNGQRQQYLTPAFNGGPPYEITGSPGYEKLSVYLHFERNTPTTLTLIKFGNAKMDTLKGEFSFEDGSVMIKKVWFNGVLQPRAFSIVR